MSRLNAGMIGTWLVIACLMLVGFTSGEFPEIYTVLGGVHFITLLGMVLITQGVRVGYTIAIIGFALFVPLGIFGAIATQQAKNKLEKLEFEKRQAGSLGGVGGV